MKFTKIPSTKAAPEDIIELLKIIEEYTGNIETMKKEIHRFLLKRSKRGKRNEYNSVYAIAFPTLKRLELIQNRGADICLSGDGKTLLKIYNEEGELEYRKTFAKVLMRVDNEKAHVIENLLTLNKKTILFEELVDHLKGSGIDTSREDDRLSRWLRLLKYADFIDVLDGKIKINEFQIRSIQEGGKLMDFNTFVNTLIDEYNRIKIKKRGSIYVKIPELESEVCERLVCEELKNFTSFDFRGYLKKLKNFKVRGKKIMFSKPGAREKGGIKINGTYYYYIAIYEQGE